MKLFVPNFGPYTPPFQPATEAPDVSNHVLPEHLHKEDDYRGLLEKLVKTHEESVLELRTLRNDMISQVQNTNLAATVRFEMARTTPLIIQCRQLFNGLPALNLSVLSLGLTGTLQVKTADMGDADYVTIAAVGNTIFRAEEMNEVHVRSNPAGTGYAVLRLTGWQPSKPSL